jgi:hypothetical protein
VTAAAADLERGYRRWLRWYPGSFRREHEEEILGVLLAGAREGQRRPDVAECLDLLRGAVWMRLRPSVPSSHRSVYRAIWLVCFGALVELAAAITIQATIGDVAASVPKSNPGLTDGQWHAVVAGIVEPKAVGAFVAVGFWLCLAWAIGRGRRWTRTASALFLGVNTWSLLDGLASGSAVYARPDLVMGVAVWLVALAAVATVFSGRFEVRGAGAGR